MNNEDIKHMAYVLLHGGFDPDSQGGCSCGTCGAIRSVMYVTRLKEVNAYMAALRERSEHA